MTKKLALVGTAPSWNDAPYDDDSWTIVSWNLTGIKLQRIDVLFEIHRRFVKSDENYLQKQLPNFKPPKTLLSIIEFPQCPANMLLDWERMKKEWGTIWLSSSIAVALAWAIEEEPEEIGMWGCDFESREEYIVQFAAIRHLLWIAEDRGIKITMPDDCLLRREPEPYPDRFETIQALVYESKAKRLQKLIERQEQIVEQIKASVWGTIGEIHAHKEMRSSDEKIEKLQKEQTEHQATLIKHVANMHRLKGELFATQHYRRLFCWNVLDPSFGDETAWDTEDTGPI